MEEEEEEINNNKMINSPSSSSDLPPSFVNNLPSPSHFLTSHNLNQINRSKLGES